MQAERTATYPAGPDGRDFVWGAIRAIHTVGDYAIVEFDVSRPSSARDDWEPRVSYSLYVRDHDNGWRTTSRSFGSLDLALVAGVAWKHETQNWGRNTAANSQVVKFFARMVGLDGSA